MAAVDPNVIDPTGDDPRAVKFREQFFIHNGMVGYALIRFSARKGRDHGDVAAEVIGMYRAARGDAVSIAAEQLGLTAIAKWLRVELPRGPGSKTTWWTDTIAMLVAAEIYADSLVAWDGWLNPDQGARGVAMVPRERGADGERQTDERLWHSDKWMHISEVAAVSEIAERTLKQWCTDQKVPAEKQKSYRGPPSWWIHVSDGERTYGHVSAEQLAIVEGVRRNRKNQHEAKCGRSLRKPDGRAQRAAADRSRQGKGAVTRDSDNDCWMSFAEAKARSGLPESTLRDMCASGEVPARRLPEGWRINLSKCADACEDSDEMHASVESLAPRATKPMTCKPAAALALLSAMARSGGLPEWQPLLPA